MIGVFAARVVVGDDDAVGKLAGDAAHFRALSLIPVAAAAEHDSQGARRMGAQRRQHVFQGIRGMGIIHIDRAARGLFADPFHAPGRTRQSFQGRQRRFRRNPRDPRQTQGAERVHGLEAPRKRQEQVTFKPLDHQAEMLAAGFGPG